jgi:hypothetical protein
MYVWIWRRLPGGLPGKLLGSAVLLAAALALLFFIVFPFAERRLPFQDITVDQQPTPQPTVTVSATP